MSKSTGRVKLPEADQERMVKLAEEVYARSTEMALIMGRHLDVRAVSPVRKLTMETVDSSTAGVRLGGIEIFIDPETGDCMLYDPVKGECIPCADA